RDKFPGGVSHIDHDAQPIALDDRVTSERRQTTLVRGLGLVVPHVAAEEVHQLQVSNTAPVHFTHTLQLALEEVATLDGLHDGRGLVPVRRLEIAALQRAPQSLRRDEVVEPLEPALREAPELAGLRLPDRAN